MNQKSEALADAIRRLYLDIGADGAEGVNLDTLRELVGAEHVVMTRVSAERTVWRGCRQFGPVAADGELAEWTTLADHRTLAGLSASGRPLRTSEFLSDAQMRGSGLYQEVLRPLNGGLAAVGCWPDDGNGWLSINYCRSLARGHDFDEDELMSLQVLAPHLQNIERVQSRLRNTRERVAAAHDMLNMNSQAIVLLDREARPVFLNRSATRLFSGTPDGLHVDASGIRAYGGPDNRRLQQAIRMAIGLSPGGGSRFHGDELAGAMALSVRRAPPQRPWVLSVVPAATLSAKVLEDGARAAVLIHNPPHGGPIAAARLVDAFGLTRREAELSVLLAQGEDLRAAAEQLALSAGTARQYLKQVFRKTGVQRQAELVRVLVESFPHT